MLIDKFLTFCRGIKGTQNIVGGTPTMATTAAIIGDVIDLGSAANFFSGVAQFIRVRVQNILVSASGTLPGLAVCGSNDWNGTTGTWTKVVDIVPPAASVAAFNAALPVDTNTQVMLPSSVPYRYLSLQFTITTAAATGGTITADLTPVKE